MRSAILITTAATVVGCSLLADTGDLTAGAVSGAGEAGIAIGDAAISEAAPPDAGNDVPATFGYRDEVSADAPLAHYRFGEATGPRLVDERGAHDGTYEGPVEFGIPGAIVGDPDTAVTFPGMGGIATLPDVFDFAGGGPFTVEMWIAPQRGDDSFYFALGKRISAPSFNGWGVYVSSANVCAEYVRSSEFLTACGPVTLAAWSHVVWTYDTATCALYVNGASAKKVSCTKFEPPDTDVPLAIGAEGAAGGAPFVGAMDELAFYDKALSPQRVLAHYKASKR